MSIELAESSLSHTWEKVDFRLGTQDLVCKFLCSGQHFCVMLSNEVLCKLLQLLSIHLQQGFCKQTQTHYIIAANTITAPNILFTTCATNLFIFSTEKSAKYCTKTQEHIFHEVCSMCDQFEHWNISDIINSSKTQKWFYSSMSVVCTSCFEYVKAICWRRTNEKARMRCTTVHEFHNVTSWRYLKKHFFYCYKGLL